MEEMTREEMQRFLIMEYDNGYSELYAYRSLMRIIGIAFPGKPEDNEEGVDDTIEHAG